MFENCHFLNITSHVKKTKILFNSIIFLHFFQFMWLVNIHYLLHFNDLIIVVIRVVSDYCRPMILIR